MAQGAGDTMIASTQRPPPADRAARPHARGDALALLAAVLCLLGAAVLMDVGRLQGARAALDRLARVAATEALAAPSPAGRMGRCRRVFAARLWNDLDVSIDDLDVGIEQEGRVQRATVAYEASISLAAGRLIGLDEVSISGSGEATRALPAPEARPQPAATALMQ
jgi:hypothetical protein